MGDRTFAAVPKGVSLAVVAALGCGGGDDGGTGPDTGPTTLATATGVRLVDADNSGDGSDFVVRFDAALDETGIAEYRALLVPSGQSLTAQAALTVPTSAIRSSNPGGPGEVRFSATSTDVTGAPIDTQTSYVARVLSVPSGATFEAGLSGPSAPVRLAVTNLVETLTSSIDAGTGGLDVDAAGDIYFADFGASLDGPPGTRVYRITPTGSVRVFATGLVGASGNDFDSRGDLFQSNISGGRISRITPQGSVSTFATGLRGPVGIAIDGEDALHVVNCSDNTLDRITPDGTREIFARGALFNCPNGITLAEDGNFYVANFGNGDVIRVAPDGESSSFVTLPGGNNGHILWGNGILYVVARAANRIYEVTLDGVVEVLAGTGARGLEDGAALAATLSLTNDVALSPDGQILYFNDVAQTGQGTRVISPAVIRMVLLEEGSDDG